DVDEQTQPLQQLQHRQLVEGSRWAEYNGSAELQSEGDGQDRLSERGRESASDCGGHPADDKRDATKSSRSDAGKMEVGGGKEDGHRQRAADSVEKEGPSIEEGATTARVDQEDKRQDNDGDLGLDAVKAREGLVDLANIFV
ncbi:MAG: hypothetical protein ACKPKO_63400, partial [Candidatus Fonsibacter sp.]